MAQEPDLESDEKRSVTVEKTFKLVVDAEPDAIHADQLVQGDSWTAKVQRVFAKYNIEQRGIERVPEDERTDTNGVINIGTMWLSANMVVSSFALGALATPVFDLGFVDTMLTILFVNMLSIIPVAFWSTLGPVFGLRQMALSRFYFGYHGVKIIGLLNALACIGYTCLNNIVGGQLLNAINHDIPGYGGVLIISFITFFVTLFGYKIVHAYEFWSWIPSFIVFLIILGEFAHSGAFSNLPMQAGSSEAASVLSFAASVFGFAAGWTSFSADYTCYQPRTISRTRVFLSTYIGLLFPLLFTQMLGAAVATAIKSTPAYAEAYDQAAIGGLLAAVLLPPLGRFGEFCIVLLTLSLVAGNCPNIYSAVLSLQVLAEWTARIPRGLWTFLATLAYIAISISGYSHFESVLENFLLVIAYWLSIYLAISITEHFVFKRGIAGYDVRIYTKPSLLPPGYAAMGAFAFGVAGAVLGMAQVWFVGPIGKQVGGPFGGDIGFELAFGFTALAYLVLRNIELKIFGR